MNRNFAAELQAARDAQDWDAHARIWEERRLAVVAAEEAALAEYGAERIAAAIDAEAAAWAEFFGVTIESEIEARRGVMRANVAVGYVAPLLPFMPAPEPTPPAPAAAPETLVLMPCSARKRDATAPARELYTGPMWQTLRTHRGRLPWASVCVLSGRFGFIGADVVIPTYEQELDAETADRHIAAGIYRNALGGTPPLARVRPTHARDVPPIRRVICAGAGHYARVFASYVAELVAAGIVAPDADVRTVNGGIGEQRGQLGRWLREIEAERAPVAR